jgi:hypothetical protein
MELDSFEEVFSTSLIWVTADLKDKELIKRDMSSNNFYSSKLE